MRNESMTTMMNTAKVLLSLCLLMIVCCTVSVVAESCDGTLTALQPAIPGHPITFELVKGSGMSTNLIFWYENDSSTQIGEHSTKYEFHHTADQSVIYLKLKIFPSDVQNITIRVESYSGPKINCKLNVVQTVAKLSGCGHLYLRKSTILYPYGLVYISDPYIQQNPDQYTRSWFHYNSTCQGGCNVTSEHEEEWMPSDKEYVFKLPAADITMDGTYKVMCKPDIYTNEVEIHVSGLPRIHDVETTSYCKNCILVRNRQEGTAITCSGEDGLMTMIIKSGITVLSTYRTSKITKTTHIHATDLQHLENITCEVTYRNGSPPLISRATLYIIDPPSNLRLTTNQPFGERTLTITCSALGRPPPDLKLFISRHQQTTENDNSSHGSTATLITGDRSLNNQNAVCCHADVITEDGCTNETIINLKFPPDAINLEVTDGDLPRYSLDPYHVINVTCTASNANPPCRLIITDHYGVAAHISIKSSSSGIGRGVDVKGVTNLNVSMDEGNHTTKCIAQCDDFPVVARSYHVNVPETPTMQINTSESIVTELTNSTITFKCTAPDIPGFNISWKGPGAGTINETIDCVKASDCIRLENVQVTDSGIYTCVGTSVRFGEISDNIQLDVQDTLDSSMVKRGEQSRVSDNYMLFVWPIAAALTLAFVVVCVTSVIVVTRSKLRQRKPVPIECPVRYSPAGAADQCVWDSGSRYAAVSPRQEAQPLAPPPPPPPTPPPPTPPPPPPPPPPQPPYQQHQATSDLIYADLDLEASTSDLMPTSSRKTEYVSIDFTKNAPAGGGEH